MCLGGGRIGLLWGRGLTGRERWGKQAAQKRVVLNFVGGRISSKTVNHLKGGKGSEGLPERGLLGLFWASVKAKWWMEKTHRWIHTQTWGQWTGTSLAYLGDVPLFWMNWQFTPMPMCKTSWPKHENALCLWVVAAWKGGSILGLEWNWRREDTSP